jgi:hypothetical protein
VHAVVLFRGSKERYLVTTNGYFFGIRSEKVSSLRSGPRLYNSDTGAVKTELGGCSGSRIEL